jgi:hypothetical protein
MITRWVASAGKHYGAYFGFEPAGPEDAHGIAARIYNATASGANQLHDYNPNVAGSSATIEAQREHFKYLFHVPSPVVPVALWYPNVSLTLKWGGFLEKAANLRGYVDIDYVDESMLRTNALTGKKILLIVQGETMEPSDAHLIAEWVKQGGRVIVMDVPSFRSVGDTAEPESILFGEEAEGRTLGKGSIRRVTGWAGLTSALTETMTGLGLSFADIKEDGIFATQISPSRFLFLNTTDRTSTVNVHHQGKIIPAVIRADTITDLKL